MKILLLLSLLIMCSCGIDNYKVKQCEVICGKDKIKSITASGVIFVGQFETCTCR